jgi:cell division protein FtsB
MIALDKFGRLFGAALMPAMALLLLTMIIGYAFLGPNGILVWGSLAREIHESEKEYARLVHHKQMLQNRVNLARKDAVDPDLAEEELRKRFGVMHPDEIAIPRK